MKKILSIIAVFTALIITSCEKDELSSPGNDAKTLKATDKEMSCQHCGGGSWDVTEPEGSQAAGLGE